MNIINTFLNEKQKKKKENYIQLKQIHISKMKDLPDRTKQNFYKKNQNIKIDSDMF